MKRERIPATMPDSPGVYFFKKGSRILYIGKATSLRDRVRSYFSKDIAETRGPKIVKMLEEASRVSWQETDSVLEALILEANLIKQHQPLYNTDEKDDKSFNHLVITDEPFPRLLIVRGRNLEEFRGRVKIKKSFGPFPSGGALREALRIIRKIFPFFDTKQPVKEDRRLAFNRQLGLYPKELDEKTYAQTIRHITLLFSGKKTALITDLEKAMRTLAKAQRFEEADAVKRQLFALNHIRDVTLIKDDRIPRTRGFRIEAFDVAHLSGEETVGVMTVVVDGEAERADYRKFRIRASAQGDDLKALGELLTRRFSHPEWPLPAMVVIDGGETHKKFAQALLRLSHPNVAVVSVVKDDRHRAREVLGERARIGAHEPAILLANSEAHRFAISWHRTRLRAARASRRTQA